MRMSPSKAKSQDWEIQSPGALYSELPLETAVSGGYEPAFGGSQAISSMTDLFCVGP